MARIKYYNTETGQWEYADSQYSVDSGGKGDKTLQFLLTKLDKYATPHVLRHTTATTALHSGMPIADISKLLGHEKIDTTMIYAKSSLSDVQAGHKKYIV